MKFELTSELTDEIIYAMENQSSSFVFDVVDCVILPESDVDSSDTSCQCKCLGFRTPALFIFV